MKFRKKPVVIEAFQWTGPWQLAVAPDWLQEAFARQGGPGSAYRDLSGDVMINTLEGTHHVSNGDWIIQGIKGELYPCKPDIFEATYEVAE